MSDLWTPAARRVTLPHGLFDAEGACHREAWLAPLTGADEAWLGAPGALESPEAVSALLAAVLVQVGGFTEVDAPLTAALTRGDRATLLLALRAALAGDRVSLVVRCANPACGERADIDLFVSELVASDPGPHPGIIETDVAGRPLVLREPTGADDAAVAGAGGSRAERAALLWGRLVVSHEEPGERGPGWWRELSSEDRQRVALALAEGRRAPDLDFVSPCPSCGALLEFRLDPAGLLTRELRTSGERLVAEIHALAFHYGWTEEEVLALPRVRRWRYVELIARQVEGRPLGEAW